VRERAIYASQYDLKRNSRFLPTFNQHPIQRGQQGEAFPLRLVKPFDLGEVVEVINHGRLDDPAAADDDIVGIKDRSLTRSYCTLRRRELDDDASIFYPNRRRLRLESISDLYLAADRSGRTGYRDPICITNTETGSEKIGVISNHNLIQT
jgi:hypothetical protein